MRRQTQLRLSAIQGFMQQRVLPVLLGIVCAMSGLPANAAQPPLIPPRPLQDGTLVEPNVLFTLDDTNSMSNDYMDSPAAAITIVRQGNSQDIVNPDLTGTKDSEDPDGDDGDGLRNINNFSYTANSLYYDPHINYGPWKSANDDIPAASWSSAFGETYRTYTYDTITRVRQPPTFQFNLSNSLTGNPRDGSTLGSGPAQTRAFFVPKDELAVPASTDAKAYWRYQFETNGDVNKCDWAQIGGRGAWAFRNCVRVDNFTWAGSINRNKQQEMDNFANWFSFHRIRMKAVKAGASTAFFDLGTDYRVGHNAMWDTIDYPAPPDSPALPSGADFIPFIPVDKNNGRFEDANGFNNRTDWFIWLFNKNNTQNGTPSRTALTHVGEYFSSEDPKGPYGPEAIGTQLRCRQNFDVFVTDGYWNDATDPVGGDGFNPIYRGANVIPEANPDLLYGGRPVNNDGKINYGDDYTYTLADVAMYYWKTDLRDDLDNDVPTSAKDPADWQHVVTFAISVGVFGYIPPTDELAILDNIQWTDPLRKLANGKFDTPTRIDDLFHAAVNSRGTFVTASSSQELSDGLAAALASIGGRTGSASNVTINSAQVGSDTLVFQSTYVSGAWTGDLAAYAFVGDTGLLKDLPEWQASKAPGLAPGSRKIWVAEYLDSNNGGGVAFNWDSLTPTQQNNLVSGYKGRTIGIADSILGGKLVNYLRGDQLHEIGNVDPLGEGLFRKRFNTVTEQPDVLGDFGNSSPVYVDADGNPDTGGDDQTVYVGGNDGMLHAFSASDGHERFAYIPGSASLTDQRRSLPNTDGLNFTSLGSVAKQFYSHTYLVDGPIAVSTRAQTKSPPLYPNGRNILVGTLGRGGKTIYALDVTTPDAFNSASILWEFSDPGTLGNALAEPVIVKLNNGQTGVIIGNGVLSTNRTSHLYILDIETGVVIKDWDTGIAGSVEVPNGMSTARYWDANADGTADFIYAGDLLGNVWKWNVSDPVKDKWVFSVKNGTSPAPLFTAKPDGTTPQPITGAIAIALDPITFTRWIFFGTGRYIFNQDPADKAQQGWYGIQDDGSNVPDGIKQEDLLVRKFVVAEGSNSDLPARILDPPTGELDPDQLGWVIKLQTDTAETEGSERIVTRSIFLGSVLLSSSIIPSADPCVPGGRGYLNAVDPFTGAATAFFVDEFGNPLVDENGVPITSIDPGVGMDTLPSIILGGGGSVIVVVGGSGGIIAVPPGIIAGSFGRISWRQIGE